MVYAPEVEDILSEVEVLKNSDDDEKLSLLSLDSEVMDGMLNNWKLHEDFVDDILKEAAFAEETIHEDSCARARKNAQTTCIAQSIEISLTRFTRVMPNGNTEIERRTNVCFSETFNLRMLI